MLHLIDNGLITRGSHSYNIAIEILGICAISEIEVSVYSCKGADPLVIHETGAYPLFEHSLYDQFKCNNSSIEIRTAEILNETFFENLKSIEKLIAKSDDLLLFPAVTQNQILGLVNFLSRQSLRNCPAILCQLMFPIDWTSSSDKSLYSHSIYRLAFDRLKKLPHFDRISFVAETSSVAAEFESNFGIEVHILPIPLGFRRPKSSLSQTSLPIRLGFLGYSKTEKGFHLLADGIKRFHPLDVAVEYFIQVNHTGWEPAITQTQTELRNIPGVTTFQGSLRRDEYNLIISWLDVLLIPYDPEKYRERGSGILAEAVALGLPVITTKGTWAARSISEGQASGVIMEHFTSHALTEAIRTITTNLADFRKRAREIRDGDRHAANPVYYIRAIENICGVKLVAVSGQHTLSSNFQIVAGRNLKLTEHDLIDHRKSVSSELHIDELGLWVNSDGLYLSINIDANEGDLSLKINLCVSDDDSVWREIVFYIANTHRISRYVQGGGFRQVELFILRALANKSDTIQLFIKSNEEIKFPAKERLFAFCVSEVGYSSVLQLTDLVEWDGHAVLIAPDSFENKVVFEDGWSSKENGWIWSVAPVAKLSFVAKDGVFNNYLYIDCWIPESIDKTQQKINIFANGQHVASLNVFDKSSFQIYIPRQIVPLNKYVSLRFEAVSAFDLSKLGDDRVLYFAISNIRLLDARLLPG